MKNSSRMKKLTYGCWLKEFNYILTLTHFFKMPIKEHTRLQYEYYYPLLYKKKAKDLMKILKKNWITNQYLKNIGKMLIKKD